MKNQYFGDINDYRKYGLIRILSDGGIIRTGICWMLTPDDTRTDVKFTQYLAKPEEYKKFDPDGPKKIFKNTDGNSLESRVYRSSFNFPLLNHLKTEDRVLRCLATK